MECSDNMGCIVPNDKDYSGCGYRKNLEDGRIFYGKNKGIHIVKKPEVKLDKLYLDCNDRNFKIGRLSKNGFTSPLTVEEVEFLTQKLTELSIPHIFYLDEQKCIMEGDAHEPANSRVNFTVPECEAEFVIANYNSCFMLKRYADGIAKALNLKGFTASVEVKGSYAGVVTYKHVEKPAIKKVIDVKPAILTPSPMPVKVNRQISFFDLLK